MYKLLIKDEADVWHVADLGGEKIAVNIQANDIAELQDRQASYSMAINLPLTITNKKIFSYLNIFEVSSTIPYDMLSCRLYLNETLLLGTDSVLKILRVTEKAIEVQILSGIADLFQDLQNTNITSIDDTNNTNWKFVVGNSATYPSFMREAPCKCLTNETLTFAESRPWYFLNLHEVVADLLRMKGFTLQSNLPQTMRNKAYFSLCNKKASEDTFQAFTGNSTAEFWAFTQRTFSVLNYTERVSTDVFDIENTANNRLSKHQGTNNAYLEYACDFTGVLDIVFNFSSVISVTESFSSNIRDMKVLLNVVKVDANGFPSIARTYEAQLSSKQGYESIYSLILVNEKCSVDVKAGEKVRVIPTFSIRPNANTLLVSASTTANDISFSPSDIGELPTGATLHIKDNLSESFSTFADVLKAYLQSFGMTCYVDNINKFVFCNTTKILYDNKEDAIDWSRKTLIGEEEEKTYQIGTYARRNYILFNEDERINETLYKGVFTINDYTLEQSKDLFTLAWQGGKDEGSAVIPIYELDENSNITLKGSKSHLVAYSESTDESGQAIIGVNHITPQDLIDNYYRELRKMLLNAKTLTLTLWLNPEDVANYTPFIPVYIERFGAYFYINKIENFIEKQKTKVELIKL